MKNILFIITMLLIGVFTTIGIIKVVKYLIPKDEATMEVETSTEALYYEVEMNVSAYCPCEKCCGRFADGITASGVAAKGKLIAAPRNYIFGTRMDVPGYGIALVQDRGGAITGNKIDLLFPNHQEALNFGRQQLIVKVYKNEN